MINPESLIASDLRIRSVGGDAGVEPGGGVHGDAGVVGADAHVVAGVARQGEVDVAVGGFEADGAVGRRFGQVDLHAAVGGGGFEAAADTLGANPAVGGVQVGAALELHDLDGGDMWFLDLILSLIDPATRRQKN